jgi:hypothetical protein
MARSVSLEKAKGVLTVTGNFSANDTVLLGGVTYKFVASPSAANDVDLGASAAVSLQNLAAAINGSGTEGTTYAADTLTVPCVVATTTTTTLTVTARFGGSWGNAIDFREGTDGGGKFSITTAISGGSGDLDDWADGVVQLNQLNAEMESEFSHFLNAPVGS